MRILMLGNSFTFYNGLPSMLENLTGAKVIAHARGGAWLAEQLNPDTKMGALTQAALRNEKWNYCILQEMSNAPITARERFFTSAAKLCTQIHANGATPVFYATWAYKRGSDRMRSMGMSYEEMAQGMYAAYHEAAEKNQALVADVGQKFFELADTQELYASDAVHPNELGSRIAAEVIAAVILTQHI